MRKSGMTRTLGLFVCAGSAAILPPSALAGPDPCDTPELAEPSLCGCGKAHMLRTRQAAGYTIDDARGFTPREALTDTDLISNDLDIEVFPSTERITGSNTMRVRSMVDGLTQFTFMLRSNFTITSATLNGVTPVTATSVGSYGRRVTLDRPYNAGEEFTLRVAYDGIAVSRGFGSIEFQTQNGWPVVATLSEAYFAATWWPTKDGDFGQPGDNSDKATLRFAITAPSDLRSVANGLLESALPVAGGKTKYTWVTNYPMATYLAAFCTTRYNTWTVPFNYTDANGNPASMPVEFNIYPNSDTASNRAAWEKSIPMLAVFGDLYGEYPFINEKYGIYQFPFGGGMEHQTNSGQGGFGESLTAHELGHQWWGDAITCRTWNDIWLNEGFATYSEALWEEFKPGSSGRTALHSAMSSRRPTNLGGSVYVYDASNMNRIFSSNYSYRKGAWVLHTLRKFVGEQQFFDILAEYRSRYEDSAATTDDFAQVVTDLTGRDMTDYFQAWVYQSGAPSFEYGLEETTINGQRYALVSIRQTAQTDWGLNGIFPSRLDVVASTSAGSASTSVLSAAPIVHAVVPIPAATTSIAIDPENWVLTDEKTLRTFVPGPPALVSISPAPNASVDAGPLTITAWFSEPVTLGPGSFVVLGPSGPVSATPTLLDGGRRLDFTLAAPEAGLHTVRLSGGGATTGITATRSGQALDGEFSESLPSGDGLPGGVSEWSFTVAGVCPADWDRSGGVDGDDIAAFFTDWQAGNADFDGSGGTDGDDIGAFFARWQVGC